MKTFLGRHLLLCLHISFWVIYGFFNLYNISYYNSLEVATLYAAELLFYNVVICYFNYFVLLPKFLRDNKLLPYVLKLIIPIGLIVLGRLVTEKYIFDNFSSDMPYEISIIRSFQITMGTLFMLVFGSLLRFTTEWLQLEKNARRWKNNNWRPN